MTAYLAEPARPLPLSFNQDEVRRLIQEVIHD